MHAPLSFRTLVTVAALGAIASPPVQAQVFTDLTSARFGTVGGVTSTFHGPVVVGSTGDDQETSGVSRWTHTTGAVRIPGLHTEPYPFIPEDVSASGAVIVGRGADSYEPQRPSAYRWTQQTGLQELAYNIRDTTFSVRTRVSGDGSSVSGFGASSAFRWRQDTGTVWIGARVDDWQDISPENPVFLPQALSWNGSIVVGVSTLSPFEPGEASLWTPQTGLVRLGFLYGGGDEYSAATGITGDGRIIVGTNGTEWGSEAFRWTADGGMVGLGLLEGARASFAAGISSDGGRIFGGTEFWNDRFHWDPFVWEARTGMRRLVDILTDRGAGDALAGWQLRDIRAFSADGRYVVGQGRRPDGTFAYWLADLGASPVPEPATIGLFASAGLLLFVVLRRRRGAAQPA